MSGPSISAFSMYKNRPVKQKPTVSKKKLKTSTVNSNKDLSKNKNNVSKLTKKVMNGSGKISKTKFKLVRRINKKEKKVIQDPRSCGFSSCLKPKLEESSKSKRIAKSTISEATPERIAATEISSSKITQIQNAPQEAFQWIVAPMNPSVFFQTHWEKRLLYIKRYKEDYYQQLLTTKKLDALLRENVLFYTRNVDVVSYVDGKRETHNPEGRAVPAALWDYYANGCSIRILNPQTYCPKLHSLLASLQEYFGCMAGVNAYLTPPGSQGFAPHYDDIEAFVLQLEGRKHWKLYAPLTEAETLPRFSSKNFDPNELRKPIKEVTLEAGDLLYFPRGVIHEGRTDSDSHSFHVTVSVYQRTAYVDLMEHILKPALTAAAQNDIEFRQGLPLQYLKHIGLTNADNSSEVRNVIRSKVEQLFGKMLQYVSIDAAADEMGKQFMWDAMPPVPFNKEKACMVHEDGEKMLNGKIYNKGEIHLELQVRLLCYHCLRVTSESDSEDSVRVYYSTDNAKYYHGEEQQFFVIDKSLACAIQCLLQNYPEFIEVKSLPLENNEVKMQIVSDLWERGLLVTEQPLRPTDNI